MDTVEREALLTETIETVLRPLKIRYAIIGGHAVTFHGRPRRTDDIDLLVAFYDIESATRQLDLQQLHLRSTTFQIAGVSGMTLAGNRINLLAPDRDWVDAAIDQVIETTHGPMISAPFLVISKLWDSRGSQDNVDILGVLKKITDNELNLTRQLVEQYLTNDLGDLEYFISMRDC